MLTLIDNLILEANQQNTYIYLTLSNNTTKKLLELIDKYNIPNPVNSSKFHISMFTSSKKPNIPANTYKLDLQIDDIKHFTIMTWYSNKKEFPDKRLMVLEFHSYQLLKLRNYLINILNIPLGSLPLLSNKFHITLSYNIGDKKSYPITKDIINPFPLEINNFVCQY